MAWYDRVTNWFQRTFRGGAEEAPPEEEPEEQYYEPTQPMSGRTPIGTNPVWTQSGVEYRILAWDDVNSHRTTLYPGQRAPTGSAYGLVIRAFDPNTGRVEIFTRHAIGPEPWEWWVDDIERAIAGYGLYGTDA